MTSLNNIEKLIQMATIEQMYTLLQNMKNNIQINENENKTNNTENKQSNLDKSYFDLCFETLNNSINNMKEEIINIDKKHTIFLHRLTDVVEKLETRLLVKDVKIDTHKYNLEKAIGLPNLLEEEHIKLKIEEKSSEQIETNIQEVLITLGKLNEKEVLEEEEEEEEESTEALEEDKEVLDEEEEEDKEVLEEDKEDLEEQEDKEDLEEQEDKEVLEEVVSEEEESEEEESEEEEVFEIEIDDKTYFATHEENGILYEVTSDGEVGKKVGIIKDGEPIFS